MMKGLPLSLRQSYSMLGYSALHCAISVGAMIKTTRRMNSHVNDSMKGNITISCAQ